MTHRAPPRQAVFGFTLVELLVVVGVIALLLSLLMPAMARCRLAAQRVKAIAGVRELLMGYTQYHQQHRGALLPGYTPPTLAGRPVTVTDRRSGHTFGLPVADRYPWRLAEYCGNVWAVLHGDGPVPPLPARDDAAGAALMKAYTLSLSPTFGLNAVFLGGHTGFAGFGGPTGDLPNTGRHVAFRASEIRRPGELIVFAESQTRNYPLGDPSAGLHYLTPPRAIGEKWRIRNGKFELLFAGIMGIPQGRYGDRTVVGFFDGHAELLRPDELADMRRWAPRASSHDYDFVP